MTQAKSDTGISLSTYITGNDAITYDTEKSSMEDVSKVDPFSIALIFILLALFFYALATAAVPPIGVGVAYGIVLTLIYAIGCFFDVFYISSVIVLVSMLGAGVDYSVFIVTRYREERINGKEKDDALKTAIMWAGESVFTSGLSVIIGFGALTICSFSMVQTMGMVLAAGIVMALLAALTLIPAVLHLLGDRIFWPNKIENYRKDRTSEGRGFHAVCTRVFGRYFGWVARVTRRFAVPIVVAAAVVSVPAVYVYSQAEDSYDMISVMPDCEAVNGLN